MADVILSQSLIQNTDASQLRDPFQQAKNQYESRSSSPAAETILSSTPFSANAPADVINQQKPLEDYKPALKALGIDPNGIAMSPVGKQQLLGRLRQKFGDIQDNPQARQALDLFDKHLGANAQETTLNLNESLANANRTLSALLGGSNA